MPETAPDNQLSILIRKVERLTGEIQGFRKTNDRATYNIKEFCALTGLKHKAVQDYCTMGYLKATQIKMGGSWIIDSSEVERIIREADKNYFNDPVNTGKRDKTILKHLKLI